MAKTEPTPSPSNWPAFVGTKESLIWIAVSILLTVIGILKSINLLSLVAYLSFAFFIVNAIMAWRMVSKVAAVRTPPPPVFAGETAAIVGRVTNRSSARAVLLLRETSGPSLRSWFLPALPGGTSLPFTGPLDFPVRGRHLLPIVEAVSSYPFGIATWRRAVSHGQEAIVLPALGSVDLAGFRRWLNRMMATGDNSRRVLRRLAPADGDVRGVRAYRDGDAPRDVHWKTSARRNGLMVREYDRAAPQDMLIIVDAWVPTIPTDRISASKLEWALSLAVSVANVWVKGDIHGKMTLLVGGTNWTSSSGLGTPAFIRTGFHALADAVGSPVIPAVPPELVRGASRSIRLLVSTRPRSPIQSALAACGVLVAAVDPSLQPAWYTPPVERLSAE